MAPSVSADPAGGAGAEACGVVRVVLLAGPSRLDVTLPAHLPLAELVLEVQEVLLRPNPRPAGAQVLSLLGRGRLMDESTLQSQGVVDGDVLVLQAPVEEVPLVLQHELSRTVAYAVRLGQRSVAPEDTRRWAVAGLALCGFTLAVLAPALAVWGPVLCLAVVAAATALVLGRVASVDPTLAGVGAAVLGVHAAAGGLLATTVAPGGFSPLLGAGCGLLVAGAVTSWSRPGVREWAVVPLVVGAGLVLASVPSTLGWQVSETSVLSAVALLLLAGAGVVRTWVVDLALVRGATPVDQGGADARATANRVASAGRLILGLDVGVALLWCCATPALVAGTSASLWLWATAVGLLLLRGRTESLLARAATAWCSGAGLLVWGLVAARLAPGAAGWSAATAGAATVVVLLSVVPLGAAVRGKAGSDHAARLGSLLELLLRVAAPSLWVLQSGLLPGAPA